MVAENPLTIIAPGEVINAQFAAKKGFGLRIGVIMVALLMLMLARKTLFIFVQKNVRRS